MTPRRVVSVSEIRIPPMSGSEDGRRWRGVLWDTDEFTYYTGDEYADLVFEDWELPPVLPPEEIRVCLDYLCSYLAIKEISGDLGL